MTGFQPVRVRTWSSSKLHAVTTSSTITRSIPPPHVVDPMMFKHVSLLIDLWNKISFPTEDDTETDFMLSDYGFNRNTVKGFLQHFQCCKDSSADHAFLMATQNDAGEDMLRLSNVYFPMLVEEDVEEWGQFDPNLLGAEMDPQARTIFPVENDDAIVLADTKEWVRKIIADFGVCPFTMDPGKAGIPMGGVRYTVSRAKSPEEAFLRYWEDVQALLAVTEREIATVLLVFPEIDLFGDYEMFEAYCDSLSDALCTSTMCMENEIQLVFFHPRYQFRDGQARTGEELGAANFARRSPWPMINILRTPQVGQEHLIVSPTNANSITTSEIPSHILSSPVITNIPYQPTPSTNQHPYKPTHSVKHHPYKPSHLRIQPTLSTYQPNPPINQPTLSIDAGQGRTEGHPHRHRLQTERREALGRRHQGALNALSHRHTDTHTHTHTQTDT